ncbi:DUF4405 domain-containing protein [Butyrivibrio sp. MB2005]|uniref:DUF4405 domain-containing protein n=1 Tax=Butyrivibrio sp. MB2005 TaxID=1280678 RepID=UPI00040EDD15|nr:DUF4405 domain-containing protein [Butyrivibrio sp. MB2005]
MNKVRMIIDILMTMLLPVLMAYSLVGEQAHEILGVLMFGLFVVHHVINRKWWTGLFRGKYNAVRILSTAVNIFLAVFMIMQPVSGILMSKYILKNVTLGGTASVMRTIHMTLAYWGFIMMSFHIGLHARMMVGKVVPKMKTAVRKGVTFLFIIGAVYGVYAFVHRGIGNYLLMKTAFAFFDMNEPRIWFFLDYMAVMILFATLGYLIQKGLLHVGTKGKRGA